MSDMPWFKFFPADWLSGTRGLTATEAGVYIMLVVDAFAGGDDTVKMGDRYYARCGLRSWRGLIRRLGALETQGLIAVYGPNVTVFLPAEWRALGGREIIPASVRRLVISRDGNVCRYCGSTEGPFHIDHVHPVALGGTSSPDNLALACAPCNLSKGARTLEEWRQ